MQETARAGEYAATSPLSRVTAAAFPLASEYDTASSPVRDHTCVCVCYHNKGLYYGFRDAILSRLVTIIKRLVHHAVYCISLSCLLSFLCNPYIPFLIYKIFHLLVSFHFLLLLAVRIIEYNNNFLCSLQLIIIKISLEAQ